MNTYQSFLAGKKQTASEYGFSPVFMPEKAFGFQRDLIEWSVMKGRAALFADCGMGKTLMQLAWAQNVAAKTGRRVLILTPLAVSHQTVIEAAKFGIEVARSNKGELPSQIVVTNYERLHYFEPDDFEGVVCDESSILKNFSGATCNLITEFMSRVNYRLLCTATAAPNDFVELGTSSEALGVMKRSHMMATYFNHDGGDTSKWRLKRHAAEGPFWQWLCTWARAIRKPSDMGYDDGDFKLPDLITRQHIVESESAPDGFLFSMPAIGLSEQREERKRTLEQRCGMVAGLANEHSGPMVCWCHLNDEGDLLSNLIGDSVQVAGSDKDDAKEEKFRAFESGEVRVMVTKPTIAGFGLNWQHCSHQTFFPSHSFEQWYQAIRRCWRFGQTKPVTIDVVTSEGEQRVLANLQKKSQAADEMFERLTKHMNDQLKEEKKNNLTTKQIIPTWL
jgi:superfamily II DNA or RNA helicase